MIELDKREGTHRRHCRVLLNGNQVCTIYQEKSFPDISRFEDVYFVLNAGMTGQFSHNISEFPGVIDALQQAHELAKQWQSEKVQHDSRTGTGNQ